MKKMFLALAIAGLAFTGMSGNDERKGVDPDKYCAEFKDGLLYVTHNGTRMTEDVKLDNGTIIHTDATVHKKDGTVTVLKEGQCVNVEGNIDPWNETPKDNEKNDAPIVPDKK